MSLPYRLYRRISRTFLVSAVYIMFFPSLNLSIFWIDFREEGCTACTGMGGGRPGGRPLGRPPLGRLRSPGCSRKTRSGRARPRAGGPSGAGESIEGLDQHAWGTRRKPAVVTDGSYAVANSG